MNVTNWPEFIAGVTLLVLGLLMLLALGLHWLDVRLRDALDWLRNRPAEQEPEEPRDYDDWSVSDTRPDDIDVCSMCRGAGEYVVSQDFETGALRIERCRRCDGRSVDPAQVPGWVAV